MSNHLPSELAGLPVGRELHFHKGELLLRPNDIVDAAFYIKSGIVHQFATSETGEEFSVNLYRAGTILPLMYLLSEDPSDHNFEALGDVIADKIPRPRFLEYLDQHPKALRFFLEKLTAGLRAQALRMEAMVFGTAQQKVAAAIYLFSKRFDMHRPADHDLDMVLTHRQIAAFTGLTRETVSTEMSRLKKLGLIDYDATGIRIPSPLNLLKQSSLRHYASEAE